MLKLAYCGIDCESCKLYKATINKDIKLLKDIAREWGALYKKTLNLSELKCLGCKSEVIYEGCKTCDIKACNQKGGIENCSHCKAYSTCERIYKFKKWQSDHNTGVEISI